MRSCSKPGNSSLRARRPLSNCACTCRPAASPRDTLASRAECRAAEQLPERSGRRGRDHSDYVMEIGGVGAASVAALAVLRSFLIYTGEQSPIVSRPSRACSACKHVERVSGRLALLVSARFIVPDWSADVARAPTKLGRTHRSCSFNKNKLPAKQRKAEAVHSSIRPDGQISSRLCRIESPALRAKIFRFRRRANHRYDSARLTRKRGGSRSSRTRGGMRWTRGLRKTNAGSSRTAKSCGPGAAVLALSFADHSVKRRWQQSRSPGRARSKP
jgi:hypothetical protein